MKKTLFLLIPAIILSSVNLVQAQYDNNWAVGFRLGEPLGANIRKYFQDGARAFDVNVGTYGLVYNNNRRYNNGEYKTAGFMVQGIYLFHQPLFGKDWGHVYYGFGGQINSRRHFPDAWRFESVKSVSKISLGPTGTAGAEFKLPSPQLAFFIDAGVYVEALPSPFFLNGQISAGLRVNMVK
ncbi:hypothetical protein [Emticicia sp. TH156]|uniref:hypothetical protein n=1 Tax=Emticicia sp. TH156 TaxID=2067454 RepID=UPI001E5DF89F|nr:hypothetical protein [Emticicia sp. TH156]